MKKRVIIVALSFVICNFIPRFPQYALPTLSTKHHIHELSKQLFKAHEAYNIAHVEAILEKAFHIFADNPAHYTEFITMPNPEGFNIIQYAAATGDQKSIERLLTTIKKYFKDDIHSIVNVLINKGRIQYSPLLLLCHINEHPAFSAFIQGALEALDRNKELYVQLIGDKQNINNQDAFHVLAKNSCNAQLKFLVKTSQELLGKHSSLYQRLVNGYDGFGNSPLVYVNSLELKNFLINHGALFLTINNPLHQRLKHAHYLGKLLISAVQHNDFKQYSHVLRGIINQYADDPAVLASALSTQDEDHWTFFHHAAARNQYDFLLSFFTTICPLFKDHPEDLFSVINAKDNEGKTGLMVALTRKHFSTAHMLIDTFRQVSTHKLYFYLIMNNKEEYNSHTPLLAATYNSTDTHDHAYFKTINLMLQSMKAKFPVGSHAFYHFINAEDSMKATALSYANSPKLRALLMKNGAVDSTARSAGLDRTSYIGV